MAEKPQQQPAEQPDPTAEQAAQLAALLVATGLIGSAAGAPASAGAGGLAAVLAMLARWGYDRDVVRVIVRVTIRTAGAMPGTRPTVRAARAREPVYDAWFILNAAKRAMERRRKGKSLIDAVKPERRFYEQRQRARKARRDAANAIDELLEQPGIEVDARRVLVWRAHADDKTTWECVAADGRWFYADTPPLIGYPGMPHGGTCRCWAVQATPDALRGDRVDDAVRSAQSTAAADHPAEPYPAPVEGTEAS